MCIIARSMFKSNLVLDLRQVRTVLPFPLIYYHHCSMTTIRYMYTKHILYALSCVCVCVWTKHLLLNKHIHVVTLIF